jgi:excinuclease UvrABC nuclease subunit
MDLREKVASLPLQPGVYMFLDAWSNILYVGKAR